MISFYPGPSKVYPQIGSFVQEAVENGLLSINHRSSQFMELYQTTEQVFKQKLAIPSDYRVFFCSSATECWEIIAQSIFQKDSLHIYNGTFGKKWKENTEKLIHSRLHEEAKIRPTVRGLPFGLEENLSSAKVSTFLHKKSEIVCLTHNETSNGTSLSAEFLHQIRASYPDLLIAVDVTSSLGGIRLSFESGDIWFASVQKCLGLPSGMAVLICSPRAIEKTLEINERVHYNSLSQIISNAQHFQTTHTPNILSIYLLKRVMEMVEPIEVIEEKIQKRAKNYYALFDNLSGLSPLVQNDAVRSATVIAVQAEEQIIAKIKEDALKQNIVLGNGYGDWKKTTFRIANFPAISSEEIELLQDFIQKNI